MIELREMVFFVLNASGPVALRSKGRSQLSTETIPQP
jgi:hypothetical protein